MEFQLRSREVASDVDGGDGGYDGGGADDEDTDDYETDDDEDGGGSGPLTRRSACQSQDHLYDQ